MPHDIAPVNDTHLTSGVSQRQRTPSCAEGRPTTPSDKLRVYSTNTLASEGVGAACGARKAAVNQTRRARESGASVKTAALPWHALPATKRLRPGVTGAACPPSALRLAATTYRCGTERLRCCAVRSLMALKCSTAGGCHHAPKHQNPLQGRAAACRLPEKPRKATHFRRLC